MQKQISGLPAVVRVAAFDIPIVLMQKEEAVHRERWGEWSASEQVIRVAPDTSPMNLLDTVIHELLHVMFWAYHLQDSDTEERVAGVLSTAWTQLFRDNPALLTWVSKLVRSSQNKKGG